ncbi:MAG: SusC/RagA family TonB-linked outer membrane protein [Bacteroidales bacterium]|nr:SusC/RagA family TonB-linked outer membrane protein [Bacteroidales bacterium]
MKRKIRQISKYLASMLAMLMIAGFVYGQEVAVTGNVTSSDDGLPIPGVTVLEKGTTNGTTTDPDGNYSITVSSDASLVFSFIGMETREVQVTGRTRIDVVMNVSVLAMEEVVVTSLGISREKKSLGYAVTEVGADDISLVKDHNPANSLVGKVAGVVVTQGTGGPGGGSRIIIRGNNSITGNNQPLIVVDGIPIDDSGMNSGGSVYSSTVTGGGITDINPDDIESISVLKGPNAAALYGSRAGNGVLLITTKSGTQRKGLGVTVNSNITFDSPMILPDYQNEYGMGTQGNIPSDLDGLKNAAGSWGPKLDGSNQLYYTGEQRPYVAQPDNVKDFFRTAGKYVNTVALDGGGENYSARFSYTNNMTESMLPNSDLSSHNFNYRMGVDLTDKLSVDAKATYFKQEINNRASQGSEGVLAYVYDMPRSVDIEDMKTYQDPLTLNSWGYSALNANPYWILYNDRNVEARERLLGFVKVNYQFTDWLSAFGRLGTDVTRINSESVNQAGHHYFMSGRLTFANSRVSETNADFLITATKDNIIQDLNISVMAGANHSYRTGQSQSVYGEDFKIPTRATIANCVTQRPSYGPLNEHIVNSVYGQISLAYNDFIYLDITGRNDWSSTLPETNRSYFYPSVTASVLLNEIIDPASEIFNLLKIRGSWANVGNDTGPYQIYSYFNVASDGYLGLTQLSRPSVRFNEDLKPENIASTEFGLEGRMFLNRVFFDIGFYQIKTTDQIYDVPVPASTGYSTFRENIGEISNKGIEVLIGGSPVRTNNFSWDLSLNFSRNVNELVELTEDLTSHVFNTTNSGNLSIQATVGGGYGDIYGTDFRRTESGELIVDAQGRPLATSDKVLLGNSQPDFIGGFQNSIRFKNISLSFLIDGRFGGEVYAQTVAALDGSGVSTESLEYREDGILVDGVVESGETFVPNTTTISAQDYWGRVSGIASSYIFKQTNIRLREFVLSYNLPSSVLTSLPIQGATIGVVGRNLFFLYKDVPYVDPEASLGTGNSGQGIISYNLPSARSIGFNINVKF